MNQQDSEKNKAERRKVKLPQYHSFLIREKGAFKVGDKGRFNSAYSARGIKGAITSDEKYASRYQNSWYDHRIGGSVVYEIESRVVAVRRLSDLKVVEDEHGQTEETPNSGKFARDDTNKPEPSEDWGGIDG